MGDDDSVTSHIKITAVQQASKQKMILVQFFHRAVQLAPPTLACYSETLANVKLALYF